MVVDNTVNLFQIADVDRLLVVVSCPEDELPALEALDRDERAWRVQTVGASAAAGLSGAIDEIGYVIDPNQHTAVIKGYVENPGRHIRAGQFVTATVNIPAPAGVVEIPVDAVVDDGIQSLVFVQPDPGAHRFTMRRVEVAHRFEHTVFVRSTPVPEDEQLTAEEAEQGLMPKEPLRPGERVLVAGPVELKAVVLDLESRLKSESAELVAPTRARPAPYPGSQPAKGAKGGKG
jgi:cobalt-zinc-cadmium efflux system membrane fusion protein